MASTFFGPPARAQGRVCSVRTLPFPREAYRARGISRSAFKLQGPTDPPLDLSRDLGARAGGNGPVSSRPADRADELKGGCIPLPTRHPLCERTQGRSFPSFRVPTARRDTRVAKGPTAFHLRLRKDQVRSADRKTRHPRCEGTDGVSPTFSDFRLTAITEAIITHPDQPFGPRQKPPDHRIERPHTWARAYAQAYVPT